MADYYSMNHSKLEYVDYETAPASKGPVVQEPMTQQDRDNYLVMTGQNSPTQPSTFSSQIYDMDPNGNIMNYPVGHPKYQPTFQDTRMQDAIALQQQENTLFMIGTVAGFSLIVLSFMIFQRQTAE